MINNAQLLKKAMDLCKENNATLVYLTLFGSELYGTNISGKSDKDIKGIFIPNEDSLLTKTFKDSIHYTTGNNDRKNTNEDVDIDLWSIQKFLNELLPCGDVGAMDVLFSASNIDTLIFMHPCVANIFLNPSKYFHVDMAEAGCEYAIHQAKKYGLKGTRLGVLKKIKQTAETLIVNGNIDLANKKIKLGTYITDITSSCYHEKYCYYDYEKEGINVLGKWHLNNISFSDFYNRITKEYETFGQRAIAAEQNNGIDYKALSHAVRALYQLQEFLLTGTIKFPLTNKDIVIKVKKGEYSWDYLNEYISKMIIITKDTIKKHAGEYKSLSRNKIRECILDIYRRYNYHKTMYGTNTYTYQNLTDSSSYIPWEHHSYCSQVSNLDRKLITTYIKCIEAQYNVKVIYATEAGSRQWGISDEASDYDVRFLFVHPKEEYSKLFRDKLKTTIEGITTFPSGHKVDFVGYDLTHFLPRFANGNWNASEWIYSNGTYIETATNNNGEIGPVSEKIMTITQDYCALWYNYKGLAKKMLCQYEKSNKLTLKELFYIFRACVHKFELELTLGVSSTATYYHFTNLKKTIDFLCECKGNTSDYTEQTINNCKHWYSELMSFKTQFKYSRLDISDSEFAHIKDTITDVLKWCKYEVDQEDNKPNKTYPNIDKIEKVFSDILNHK